MLDQVSIQFSFLTVLCSLLTYFWCLRNSLIFLLRKILLSVIPESLMNCKGHIWPTQVELAAEKPGISHPISQYTLRLLYFLIHPLGVCFLLAVFVLWVFLIGWLFFFLIFKTFSKLNVSAESSLVDNVSHVIIGSLSSVTLYKYNF